MKRRHATLGALVLLASAAQAQPAAKLERLRSGNFRGVDARHQASGEATLYRKADGSFVLRLRKLKVAPEADLVVYLSKHDSPGSAQAMAAAGALSAGKLKDGRSEQSFELPRASRAELYNSVAILGQRAGVLFASAAWKD